MINVEKYFKEHTRIVVLGLLLIGLLILYASTRVAKPGSEENIIMVHLGAASVVTALAMLILSYSVRGIEKRLDDEINGLTVRLDVVSEAKKCGVVHIFECRWKDQNYKKELIKQLKSTDKPEEVLIMSNSLRDFFGPGHDKGYLSAILEMLRKGIKVRILLLDPISEAAKARTIVEEKEKVMKDGYIKSALFTEINYVANWLDSPPTVLDKDIKERIKSQIEVRFFPYDPTTHIIRTDKFTFVEQYHRGGDNTIREELEKEGIPFIDCFGGFVPVLMVDNSGFFANLLKSHFNNIWFSQDVEERDLRKNNYYQKIIDFEKNEARKFANFS